jgi:hypothetical protein
LDIIFASKFGAKSRRVGGSGSFTNPGEISDGPPFELSLGISSRPKAQAPTTTQLLGPLQLVAAWDGDSIPGGNQLQLAE